MAFLNECDSELVAGIRRGDVLENVDQSQYRDCGIYFFDVDPSTNALMIRNMNFVFFEYGSVPWSFKVITEFPNPNHWQNFGANIKCFPGTHRDDAQTVMLMNDEYVSLPIITLKPHMYVSSDNEVLHIDYGGILYTVRDAYLVDLVLKDAVGDSDKVPVYASDISWVLRETGWSFSPVLCFV